MPPSYREGLFQASFIVMSGFIRVLYAATLCIFPQTRVKILYFSNRDLSRKSKNAGDLMLVTSSRYEGGMINGL